MCRLRNVALRTPVAGLRVSRSATEELMAVPSSEFMDRITSIADAEAVRASALSASFVP